jgi:ribokinase
MDGPSDFSPKFDVVVCGSLHLDIVVHAPALPMLDETAVGSSWKQVCGGKGGNQAVQAVRAGARTAMIGRIGNDDFGRTLLDNLRSCGVDAAAVSTDAALGTGMSVAILQDSGDYGAVIVSGSNLAIKADALEQVWSELGGAKVLVLQNEVPHAVNVAAALAARQAGATVLLNAAPARPLDAELLDNVDVLIVNRVEAEGISGMVVSDQFSAIGALPRLTGDKRSVVITLGGSGLVVSPQSGDPVGIEAVPVKVTSTHGAGDCFVGVLAARIAAGMPLVDACHFANREAATYVSRPQARQ